MVIPLLILLVLLPSHSILRTSLTPPPPTKLSDKLFRNINHAMKATVISPLLPALSIRNMTKFESSFQVSKLLAPPEIPGIARPVALTILGSIPTLLLWYGYYKFSVEEELYHYELETFGEVKSAGGFGTLLPFTWCFILGNLISLGGGHDVGNALVALGGGGCLLVSK